MYRHLILSVSKRERKAGCCSVDGDVGADEMRAQRSALIYETKMM